MKINLSKCLFLVGIIMVLTAIFISGLKTAQITEKNYKEARQKAMHYPIAKIEAYKKSTYVYPIFKKEKVWKVTLSDGTTLIACKTLNNTDHEPKVGKYLRQESIVSILSPYNQYPDLTPETDN